MWCCFQRKRIRVNLLLVSWMLTPQKMNLDPVIHQPSQPRVSPGSYHVEPGTLPLKMAHSHETRVFVHVTIVSKKRNFHLCVPKRLLPGTIMWNFTAVLFGMSLSSRGWASSVGTRWEWFSPSSYINSLGLPNTFVRSSLDMDPQQKPTQNAINLSQVFWKLGILMDSQILSKSILGGLHSWRGLGLGVL